MLEALRFLQTAFFWVSGHPPRPWAGAMPGRPVTLDLTVGDTRWALHFVEGADGEETCEEALWQEGREVFSERLDPKGWTRALSCWSQDPTFLWMQPFIAFLRRLRFSSEADASFDRIAEAVRRWFGPKEDFAWLIQQAERAFPQVPRLGEQMRSRSFYHDAQGTRDALATLISAIQSKGSSVVFDNWGASFHPHAVRALLAALREAAEAGDRVILLTSHSPVVLNGFNQYPDQVFVMDSTRAGQPARLTDLISPDALAQTDLGDLYSQLAFGSPFSGGSA